MLHRLRTLSTSAAASLRRLFRSDRSPWALGAGVVMLIAAGTALAIWDLRRQAIEDQTANTQVLGAVLAEQTLRYLQVVDLGLQTVEARVHALGIATPEHFRQALGGEDTYRFLYQRLQNLPQANAFLIDDVTGHLVNSTRAWPPPATTVLGRDFYEHFLRFDDPNVFVSETVRNRVTGTWALFLARRIEGPDRRLLGIVSGAVDTKYLDDFYEALHLPQGETVTLLRRDGLVLVRHPDLTHDVGHRMSAASPWFARVAGGGGTYLSPGFLGGHPAVVSVHPLPQYPLVVDVSMQEWSALAVWRRQAAMLVLCAIAASCGFLVLLGVVAAQFRRQQQQNSALRQSETRLRDYAELASDWFWEMDDGLRLTWVSDGSPMVRRSGAASYLGKRTRDMFDRQGNDPRWARIDAVMLARKPFTDFRFNSPEPSGKPHCMSANGMPVYDGRGVFVGYRGTGRDVTEEVCAQEEIQCARDRAEAASRAKSEFLANMSHELRTPLNAIIGFSELIRDQPFGPVGEQYVEYAKDIHAGGRHLLELINDILDLSKIEAGRFDLAEETVELGALVRGCLGLMRARAREAGVLLAANPAIGRVALRADQRALMQVLLNLLSNAVKFTPSGGTVSVEVEHRADGGVAVAVHDTGIGIDPAVLAQLGEPFQQADASISRRFGGSGLGLAISRRLLTLHGGALELDSRPGEGTTAHAVLPPARVVQPAARAVAA